MTSAVLIRMFTVLAGLLLLFSITLSFSFDSDRFYSGMGSEAAIAPQDNGIVFTYYVNGTTHLYRTSMEGGEAERLTETEGMDETSPAYSPDGSELLFLGTSNSDVQSLYTVKKGETEPVHIPLDRMHVEDAVYSPDGTSIYAAAISREDWMSSNTETAGGFDIYEINRDTGTFSHVTEQDYYLMNNVSISPSGDYLMFTTSSGNEEEVQTVSLTEKNGIPPDYQQFPAGMYDVSLAPDGEQMAYSAVSNTAESGNFQYDLFLFNHNSGQTERLTSAATNITSPVFYHESNRILYIEDMNWPGDVTDNKLQSMDLSSNDVTTLEPEISGIQHHVLLGAAAGFFMNNGTTAALGFLFGLSAILLLRRKPKLVYLPAVLSALLSAAAYIMNALDPWTYQFVILAVGPASSALLVLAVLFWLSGAVARKIWS
ncbi:TolB family protein [Salibacterium sp. K-3]